MLSYFHSEINIIYDHTMANMEKHFLVYISSIKAFCWKDRHSFPINSSTHISYKTYLPHIGRCVGICWGVPCWPGWAPGSGGRLCSGSVRLMTGYTRLGVVIVYSFSKLLFWIHGLCTVLSAVLKPWSFRTKLLARLKWCDLTHQRNVVSLSLWVAMTLKWETIKFKYTYYYYVFYFLATENSLMHLPTQWGWLKYRLSN